MVSDIIEDTISNNQYQTKMHIKIHESYRTIVALAASNLIGKMNSEDATINKVGEESVKTALELGIIGKHGIIKIQDVPVALGLF